MQRGGLGCGLLIMVKHVSEAQYQRSEHYFFFGLKKEIEVANQLIEKVNDRYNKREAKSPLRAKISDSGFSTWDVV